MTARTDAWVLHAGPDAATGAAPQRGLLEREQWALAATADHEALVEPIFGSWEANLDHALSRSPIDICRARGEESVILGNLGVVRVLRTGRDVAGLREGDLCLVMPFGVCDRYGYAELVYAYDCPGTTGILARRTNIAADLLLPVPVGSGYDLTQWAAYGRYFTAWDNWRTAVRAWRIQLPDADPADSLVFGWGGGVVLAELLLARADGFRVAMTASSDERIRLLESLGITAVDRRELADLGARRDADGRPLPAHRYRESERRFLDLIAGLSDGAGVSIFIDNIGAPLYKPTVKSLAREGVLSTVGWKQGMKISQLRAADCIKRQLHVNTHVWRKSDSAGIRDFQEAAGWIAAPEKPYAFEDVPALAADYLAGRVGTYFPIFAVNPQ
ncbi:MAG TPA: zinc-binding dehydrogenase [Cellulomonas sp.]